MGVRNGQPQRIGSVFARQARQFEQAHHHFLHLRLGGLTMSGTAFFICNAVYSATGKSLKTKPVTHAPRA